MRKEYEMSSHQSCAPRPAGSCDPNSHHIQQALNKSCCRADLWSCGGTEITDNQTPVSKAPQRCRCLHNIEDGEALGFPLALPRGHDQ